MIKKVFKKEYLLFIFLLIAILSTIIIKPLGDLDEIWNYNVAKNMANGKIPYKDISTITTPLLPAINSIFLSIFGNQLIIMRILVAILGASILFTIFKIFKKLTKETNISMICTLLIGILLRDVYCIEYNFATLLITLIILYLEIKNSQNKKENQKTLKHNLILGVLAGLAICTKQSTGLMIAIATAIYPVFNIKTKNDLKIEFKNIGFRILGIIIPGMILLIYLLLTNSIKDLISYGIQGISTFDNKIPYKTLFKNEAKEIAILSKVIPYTVIIMILTTAITFIKYRLPKNKEKNETEEIKNIQILTLYSLPMLIVIYPISDKIHFLIGTTISIIAIVYLIMIILKKLYNKIPLRKKKFIYKTTTLILWLILAGIIAKHTVGNLIEYNKMYKNNEINLEIPNYKYINVPDYLKQRIDEIGNYIKYQEENGKKVYILDAEAAVYKIPLNKYTKDYDMFLKGNLGKDGENGQIEKIQKEADENTIYLIKKQEYGINWQTPMTVINYIKENFTKTGEISIYDTYVIQK